MPRIISSARKGRLAIIGDGQNKVDITHVKNAALAHLLALDALQDGRACGKPYFISQDKPVKLWDWINDLLARLNEPTVTRRIPLQKAYRIGGILEGVYKCLPFRGEPPMTRFVAIELGKDHYFSIKAAKDELAYPPEVSIEAGLQELVEALKNSE